MGRNYTRVHRLLRLIQIIQSTSGLNAAALARRCDTGERNIYRDLDTLNASGVPCYFDPETSGYRLRRGFFMPPVELTFEEAMAMVALLEHIDDDTQVPFLDTARRVAEKVRSQLPEAVMNDIEPLDGRVRIDLARRSVDDSARTVYSQARQAIADKRMLHCTYEATHSRHGDQDQDFLLKPYALHYSQRAWYCIGHHSRRDAVRMLKLNRFTYIAATDRPYAIPGDFSFADFLGHAWRMIRGDKRYDVVIRFTPAFADNASETLWHPTQQEQWHEDGSVTLSFSIDGLDEIVWWVLGWGPGAKVLQPPELIDRIRQLAAQAAEQYRR